MSPTPDELAYAVMQDSTILCGDCIPEVCDDCQPTEATLVHAWLFPDLAHTCNCCGASTEPIADERCGERGDPACGRCKLERRRRVGSAATSSA
jgi:hypothetical protein